MIRLLICWVAVGASAMMVRAQNGWSFVDEAQPQPAGSLRMPSDTSAIVTGGGAGIGGINYDNPGGGFQNPPGHLQGVGDQFGYMQRSASSSDQEFVARLVSVDGPAGAQAGIVIRANAGSASGPYALSLALVYRQGQDLAVLTRRDVIGYSNIAESTSGPTITRVLDAAPHLPLWVRVQYTRGTYFASSSNGLDVPQAGGAALFSTSTNGVDWTPRYWELLRAPFTDLGLGVSGAQQGVAATANFDNLHVGPLNGAIAPPAAPANFRIKSDTSSSVAFAWDDDPVGVDDFELERSTAGGPFERIMDYNSRVTHSDLAVAGGVTYAYRVRFVRGPAVSDWSPTLTLTTPYIAAPTNLVADTSTPGQVTLHWNDNSSDETNFEIEKRIYDSPFDQLVPADTTQATLTSLSNDVTYYFRVRSRRADAVSAFSNEVVVRYGLTPTGAPSIVYQPTSGQQWLAATTSLFVDAAAPDGTYSWLANGKLLTDAHESTLTLGDLQPGQAGVYQAVVSDSGGVTHSQFALLGLRTIAKVAGSGSEVGSNIRHPNGNIYDQILMTGPSLSVTCNPGQVVRVSFVDLSDDIVQVEYSGIGTLTIVLDSPSGPAPAANYNQPGVLYMKGHAGITVSGGDRNSYLSVFSVGRATAVDQSIFRSDVQYEGVADLAFIAIQNSGYSFGGIRAANASFWSTRGITGIYAPGVSDISSLYVCDITATEDATPVLVTGSYAKDVRITGGDLLQTNGQPILTAGIPQISFVDGTTSQGDRLPAQRNRARFVNAGGQDVTDQIQISQP